ncbi:MAG: hypothetical protein ACJAWV_003413 [Flammeovirgaceae bacterium]|jgi:uncharacterized protein YkwD
MKKNKSIFLMLCFMALSFAAQSQSYWNIENYNDWTHQNFRQNPIFKQTFSTSNPDYLLLDAALFYLTNAERAKIGIAPMRYHRMVEIAAYNHSYRMGKENFFSHTNSNSMARKSPSDRGKLAGIANAAFAENIAYNYPSSGDSYLQVAEALMNQWMNSKGHKDNILSEKGRQMGCGTYFSGGKIYGTQCFQWFSDVQENTSIQVDKLPPTLGGKNNNSEEPIDKKPVYEKNPNNNDGGNNEYKNTDYGNNEGGSDSEKETTRNKKPDNSQLFSFKLGGHLNYVMGEVDNLPSSFDSQILSGHAEAMLGVRFGHARKKSAFGIFGSYGKYSEESSQRVVGTSIGAKNQITFYAIEGGFVFGEWLRLSGGKGWENLDLENIENEEYITATLGFAFGPKNFKVEINNNILFPQEENKIIWRPSVGLAVKLDFFRR